MKTYTKLILQKTLGLSTYLYFFALFVIVKFKFDKNEKDIFHFLKLLPKEGIVLDLGANIGVTSYHLAKNLPVSQILSFEPLELNMNVLRKIKTKFNLQNIKEFQLAVGNDNTRIEMIMPVIDNVPMHGLSHAVHESISWYKTGLRFEVPMIKLDSLDELINTKRRITGIKIDVENFEYFVLKGAEQIIKKHKPVIYCELWDNQNRTDCISLLNSLGYSVFVLDKKELITFDPIIHIKQNFFFIPDSLNA